jgi:hypothetical protein
VSGEWRELHNQNNLYCPPNIIRENNSCRMKQAEHKNLVIKRRRKIHLGDLFVNVRILLKWVLKYKVPQYGFDLFGT